MNTHNKYHLELIDSLTGEVRQVVDCHNIVRDTFYTALFSRAGNIYTSLNAIALGTGSTEPSASDTGFTFALVANGTVTTTKTYPTGKKVIQCTFPAGTGALALTECCVGYGDNSSYTGWSFKASTHAKFTDAEGNPIVINKADTDILVVTVTLNFNFTLVKPANEGIDVFTNDNESNLFYRHLVESENAFNADNGGSPPKCYLLPHKAQGYRAFGLHQGTHPVVSPNWATYQAYKVHAVQTVSYPYTSPNVFNGDKGFDLKAIYISDVGVFNITSDIFPPTPFGKYQLGVGDGATLGYDIKTPSCKEGTQKVYVNSVLQTEGVDYTFYPYNAKDYPTNLIGSDCAYCIAQGKANYDLAYLGTTFYPGVPMIGSRCALFNQNNPTVYDFKIPIKVNAMLAATTGLSTLVNKVQLEYSTDGSNWQLYKVITSTMLTGVVTTYDEVVARYWRYITVPGVTDNLTFYGASVDKPALLFGYYRPSVLFTVAPAPGAVIEIEYDLQYPLKDSLHGFSFSYTLEEDR